MHAAGPSKTNASTLSPRIGRRRNRFGRTGCSEKRFLGLITIIPAFAVAAGVNTGWAIFFGGTSLLILVGVVLDTLQQIESHLLMRKYDGLVKSGKLKGRAAGMQQIGAPM